MYLHCRHGFVEADAWDGQPVPIKSHRDVMDALVKVAGAVIVVRARRSDTLAALAERLPRRHACGLLPKIEVIKSPPGWDYEWRMYLTAVEWGMCMTTVAMDLDYRNFKHTAQAGHGIDRREYALAYDIWTAAYKDVPREKEKHKGELVPMGEGQCVNCGLSTPNVFGPKNPRGFDVYLGECCGGDTLTLKEARELVGIDEEEKAS